MTPRSERKRDWCFSAIISLFFGAATAFIFYYIVLFGVGDDGYLVIFSICTAPVAIIFGVWGLVYWRSLVAFIGLFLCLSPLIYLGIL
ncbi:hypothetical protein HED50_02420 [Ochrobactrum oryzae]|uniref:Uncharacterized protein n=1 Tax=Brucella oryzae TaxID=335286 RepID=A0A2S7J5K7_9HYPH|nr:hypothetical protein [Brucella oryzae]MBR7652006.1 hypothetical protein [Brucella oryzae]NKC21916.1 hypothetical protein [Brucella oryzae]PQA75538.1 hypothetical protein C3731_00855 [Brucella oryzae]